MEMWKSYYVDTVIGNSALATVLIGIINMGFHLGGPTSSELKAVKAGLAGKLGKFACSVVALRFAKAF